jgi:hypothetical protein
MSLSPNSFVGILAQSGVLGEGTLEGDKVKGPSQTELIPL